ncbi:uncharacterized protein IWZ02DRAFT_105431 [Phyllosticta citriasiana]|uniref:uncharacterized protein n=1 Tax=Phyllosticta citriasiana TaxID=595635 RepID=UPI0030FD7CE9
MDVMALYGILWECRHLDALLKPSWEKGGEKKSKKKKKGQRITDTGSSGGGPVLCVVCIIITMMDAQVSLCPHPCTTYLSTYGPTHLPYLSLSLSLFLFLFLQSVSQSRLVPSRPVHYLHY